MIGGLSFALARYFPEVIGIDYSHHFIEAANEMKLKGFKEFSILKQGSIYYQSQALIDNDVDRNRVSFQQGDACNLNPSLGKIILNYIMLYLHKLHNVLLFRITTN